MRTFQGLVDLHWFKDVGFVNCSLLLLVPGEGTACLFPWIQSLINPRYSCSSFSVQGCCIKSSTPLCTVCEKRLVSALNFLLKFSSSPVTRALLLLVFYSFPLQLPPLRFLHTVATFSPATVGLLWHLTQPPTFILSHAWPSIICVSSIVILCHKWEAFGEVPAAEVSLQVIVLGSAPWLHFLVGLSWMNIIPLICGITRIIHFPQRWNESKFKH